MIGELFSQNTFLWSCAWQSTACVVLGLASSYLLRRQPGRAHQVLFLSMIAAVIVPIMSILVKHYELGVFVAEPVVIQSQPQDRPTASNYGAYGIMPVENIEHKPGPIGENSAPAMAGSQSAKFPWRLVVLSVWITASSILATRLLVTFVLGVRLLGRALPLDCERIEEAAHLARAKLGIDKDVKVRSSRSVRSPVIWCWKRRPILLVPSAAGRLDNGVDWAGVLCHELAHWKRRDHIRGLLAELVVCILPWHPLVWWAKSRLVRLSEQACDDWVVATGQPCTDYAESLLDLTPQGQMAFVPAVVSSKRGLAGRVRRILKDSCSNPRAGLLWALAVSIVAACLAIGVACAQTRPAKPEAASQDKSAKPLHQAAADGDINKVRSLISKGASVNAKDNEGRTPLFYAVENDHILMVDLLVAKGADIDAKDAAGDTPLHHAARDVRHRDWQFAAELARRGADVNAMNNRRQIPLHVALQGDSSGHRHVASHLLRYDVNVNAKDSNGKTALHLAAQRAGNLRFIRWILAKGADVTLTDARGQTALHIGCDYNSKAQEVISTIIERANGVNLNVLDSNSVTPLHIAALRGRTDACETLIANGAKVDAKDKNGHTPAHHALRAGNIETADSLIKNGADISSIHLSAYKGNLSSLKTLLTRGASVNEKDETGFTPLHAAAAGGHREIVKYLISQGADVKVEGGPGWTALSYAARDNHKKVVEVLRAKGVGGGKEASRLLPVVIKRGYSDMATILIALGADINVNDGEPLIMAARHGHKDIVELLISKGAAVNAGKWSPLYPAATSGHIDIAKYLIEAGADVNGKVGDWSPLGSAVGSQNKRMVEFLLSKDADVNKGGWAPLHHAVHYGYIDIVKLLLEHGADVNQGDNYTPLGLAAWYVPVLAELLIDSGADVNAISPESGWTPLHWSVYGDNRDVFDLLVSRGADVNARTHTEETVLHLLIQWGEKADHVEFVLSRGVDINAADACGWTALHRAVLYNRPEIAELLIAEGADVNLRDSDGRTSLWLAKERGHTQIVELLRKHGARN